MKLLCPVAHNKSVYVGVLLPMNMRSFLTIGVCVQVCLRIAFIFTSHSSIRYGFAGGRNKSVVLRVRHCIVMMEVFPGNSTCG